MLPERPNPDDSMAAASTPYSSPPATPPMLSQISRRNRLPRLKHVDTRSCTQTPLKVLPQSSSTSVANLSLASSSAVESPVFFPETPALKTRNSSVQLLSEPYDGMAGDSDALSDLCQLSESEHVFPRKSSSHHQYPAELGVTSHPSTILDATKNGLVRRVSVGARNIFRPRQSSSQRAVSVGPGVVRRRSDSNSTAPPVFTDSQNPTVMTDSEVGFFDDRDDAFSVLSASGSASCAGSATGLGVAAAPRDVLPRPAISTMPLPMRRTSTRLIKVSSTRSKRKPITLTLDPDTATIYGYSRTSKCIHIDNIKDIRLAQESRQSHHVYDVSDSDVHRLFSILYFVPGTTRIKMMHLIAEDDKTYKFWVDTLGTIAKNRQDFMTSLMAFHETAIYRYWKGEMDKKFCYMQRTREEERIDFQGVERVCRQLHIRLPICTLEERFREAQFNVKAVAGDGRVCVTDHLDYPAFQEFVRLMKFRQDIRPIYCSATSQPEQGLTYTDFLDFLRRDQGEMVDDDAARWRRIFARFASGRFDETDKLMEDDCCVDSLRLSESAFTSFLMSADNLAIAPMPHEIVLDRPVNEYFISSSHNTYLLGRQVADESSVEGYILSLIRGCRCVEIDCWDGPNNDPIVKHGRAFTTSILFRDVIKAIDRYAFYKSHFPLWISLEVRCGLAAQEAMAHIMIETFGDKLVRTPLYEDRLPSPSELKGCILIKVKKPSDSSRASESRGRGRGHSFTSTSQAASRPIYQDNSRVPSSPVLSPMARGPRSTSTRRVDTIFEGGSGTRGPFSPVASDSDIESDQDSTNKDMRRISPILGELAVYSVGCPFDGFDTPKAKTYNHIFSFQESTFAKRLAPASEKRALFQHNIRHLMRVYPHPMRIKSTNFDPLMYWKRGVQMAALNWQTFDLGMQLNQAMFDSGADQSGYVLKPANFRGIGPMPGSHERHNVCFSIAVLSAQQLMRPSTLGDKRTLNPYVEVEVSLADDKRDKPTVSSSSSSSSPSLSSSSSLSSHTSAIAAAQSPLKLRTQIVRENGFNPVFDSKFDFNITTKYPDLIFVRWSVKLADKTYQDRVAPLATFTAKLSSLRPGYHPVPLLDANGDRFLFSTLFCHIKKEPVKRLLVPPVTEDNSENHHKFINIGRTVFNRATAGPK